MKKKIFCFLLPLLFLMLCACGGGMDGWPTLNLNLDTENYDKVSLEYHHISKHSDRMPLDVDEDYYGTSSDREVINGIYQHIDLAQYSEKTYNKVDTEKYTTKVIITFWKDGEAGYTFVFFEYGIKNGYFVLDNGEIHKHLGNFSSIYETWKDKLIQEQP